VVWQREAHRGKPSGGRHRKNTYASETPATDGERVYASFGGNVGLFCYSREGTLVWKQTWPPQPIYLDFGTAFPDRCLTVWNEQLSADPVQGFEAIHDFLGIRHHPGSANYFGKQRLNSSWVRDPSRPDDDDWTGWDRKRRGQFVELAGATMVRAGYGPMDGLRAWADSAR